MAYEITKLIKFSPQHETLFKELKPSSNVNPTQGIQVLFPTQWMVHADSLASILNNYSVLLSTWEEAMEVARNTETKARIIEVSSQMKNSDFLFGMILCEDLL